MNFWVFGINDSITRAAAALVIAKELDLPLQHGTFNDVKQTHWASEYIGAMEAAGILSGYNDGSFRPNASLSREEMATLIVRAYNLTGESPVQFSDVKKDSWSYDYIETLVANKIVTGFPDGTFHPKEPIKRAEFAVMMSKLLNEDFR